MANDVFANGREISCKAGDGKSICAFPDVCFTPPQSPATPPGVPVPYPNTGFAKDTTSGSRSVKITRKEVMLKNKSYFKKSTGDEAGSAPKKGIVTSVNRGKVYFISWSMDVKVEGENVVRHLDMTTHNHASPVENTPPTIHLDRMSLIDAVEGCQQEKEVIGELCSPWEERAKCPSSGEVDKAKEHQKKVQDENPFDKNYLNFPKRSKERPKRSKEREEITRKNIDRRSKKREAQKKIDKALEKYARIVQEDDCHRSLRCALTTYSEGSTRTCCPPQTPEHLIPASQFGRRRGKGHKKYKAEKAACMCAEGGANAATHGLLGRGRRRYMERNGVTPGKGTWTVAESAECGAAAAAKVEQQCSPECIKAQLLKNHKDMDIELEEKIRTIQNNEGKNLSEFEREYRDQSIMLSSHLIS